MDVLSPDLFWIEDRCYRIPNLDGTYLDRNNQNFENEDIFETDLNFECRSQVENDCDDESFIEKLSEGRYKLKLQIAQTFWPKIIGSKGATRRRIENDTKTKIIIPKPMEQGDVEIRGSSKSGIILARKCIKAIVSSSRQKLAFTHFISVPMNSENIIINFNRFKDEVLKFCGTDRGVDPSIFQNSNKLHLTIAMLVLADQSERKEAEVKLFEVYDKTIKPLLQNIDGKPLIEMKGVEYMNDDPSEVDVLYAKVTCDDQNNILQRIADSIVKYFTLHELIQSDNREHLKLHVTLMNTLFREQEPEEVNEEAPGFNKNVKFKKPRQTFNAVNILKKFQDYYFGVIELSTIELSVRFSTGENGYYKSSCSLNLQYK